MLNSDFINGQAALLAERIHAEAPDDDIERIRHGVTCVLRRPALEAEVADGLRLLAELRDDGLDRESAFELYCLLLLNLNEFMYLD